VVSLVFVAAMVGALAMAHRAPRDSSS
jgi:hypothetical protein